MGYLLLGIDEGRIVDDIAVPGFGHERGYRGLMLG